MWNKSLNENVTHLVRDEEKEEQLLQCLSREALLRYMATGKKICYHVTQKER